MPRGYPNSRLRPELTGLEEMRGNDVGGARLVRLAIEPYEQHRFRPDGAIGVLDSRREYEAPEGSTWDSDVV